MIFLRSHIKMRSKEILIFSFLILLFYKTYAQQYFVKYYNIEDGLPTRNINDACQDKTGIMWFATNSGISKYDGFAFTNYDSLSGLPNQRYRKIKIDERGVLWALPIYKLDSIVFFRNNSWQKIPPPEKKMQNHHMTSFDIIYRNNNPVICMGSYDGFYIFEKGSWTHFAISDDENLNYVYSIVAKKQTFYLSTKKGICTFTNGKPDWSLNNLIQPFDEDIISISFENKNTPDEKLWVLNEKWLGYIQHNRFVIATDKFRLPHPSIFYYAFVNSDKKGNVFFGNIWAKYYINQTSDIPIPLMFDNGFSSHGATSVFVDREQNIWITDTRGINKINNLKVINYFKSNGMLEDEVTAIAEMNDGKIVMGHNKGLSVLNNNAIKTIEFPDLNKNTRRVADMMKDQAGNIWFVSLSDGLGKMLPNGEINWFHSEKYPNASVVHQDKSGRIWVGSDKKLLYVKDNTLVEYSLYKEKQNIIRRIFSADDGGIYIAGSDGLWYLNGSKEVKIPSSPDKKADNVFSYFKDKNGVEFVGTMQGLYVIDNGRIVKYKKDGIEINNPVFFILQDNGGNFWLGSNIGVYKWDGEKRIEVYNVNNGLAGWETNRAAGLLDSKGRVWIGTDRGLTCFEPDYDKAEIPTPVIKLLNVEDSKGTIHELSKKCSINYSDNTLIFRFRGISYFNEDLLVYKYKLEGFDTEWQDGNQSMLDKVKYIGLRPGKYTFCVMAKNFSGKWSEVSRSEVITITHPVYLTWWFLLVAMLVTGGIIYGIIKINVQRLHNSRLKNEITERKQIEQELTENRQKYQDLVELLPETIYEADYTGKLVYLNDTGFRLFGYEPGDLRKDLFLDQLIAAESSDEIHLHLNAVYDQNRSDRAILTGVTKTGKSFPLSIHTVPIILNTRCVGTRGIIINLTEQKSYEDQLQKNAEDLQALNKSKDKFFSIIAHDLRSPFTSFLGFTEILDEEIDTLAEKELKNIVSYMRHSAANLYQLLENLLEWSLLQREITTFEPQSILLLPVVGNCIDLSSDSIKQKDIDFSYEIPANMEVIADIHMLQTIIRNLLSNAVKFTHRGGKVQISARVTQEHFVTIAVTDTGIGIPQQILEKIFQIDANNKTKGTEGELSTGLGLILCREFVEKHGGKIWVESIEENGSTFYFTLKTKT